jgi:hypothetical protein
MSVETDQDRLNILLDFGQTVTVDGKDILGIFDREFKDIGGVETYYPLVECRRIDAPNVKHQAPVIVDGETFHVVGIENDREGMQQLILSVGASNKYQPTGGASAYPPTVT